MYADSAPGGRAPSSAGEVSRSRNSPWKCIKAPFRAVFESHVIRGLGTQGVAQTRLASMDGVIRVGKVNSSNRAVRGQYRHLPGASGGEVKRRARIGRLRPES